MATDKEIALRVEALQSNGRDVPMMELPGYMEWSCSELDEGVSPAVVAHLDSMSMFLLPKENQTVGTEDYEELLADYLTSSKNSLDQGPLWGVSGLARRPPDFHSGNLLCWAERPGSAKSGPSSHQTTL